MQQSPAFSSFRELMDTWDEASLIEEKDKENKQNKVKSVIDGKNLIMFFKKGDSIFGAPEDSRIVYAQLMNPDDDWVTNDANFLAHDLVQALSGNSTDNLFSQTDLPQINIITRDEAENELMKCPSNAQAPPADIQIMPQSKLGVNKISLKDKE